MDSTTGGPMVRLGTKWPSMTSRCRREAPPRSTRAISSARRAKSADRMEGTISIIGGLIRFYHSGEEAIPSFAPGQPVSAWNPDNLLVFFGLQGTGGVDQNAPWGEHGKGIAEESLLPLLEVQQVGRGELPLDLGIASERPRPGAGRVDQNSVEAAGK